jgi:hypothetical protein
LQSWCKLVRGSLIVDCQLKLKNILLKNNVIRETK